MADDLKGKWKETSIGLGHAFRDLGKTIIKSGATAVKKADSWANSDDSAENVAENAPENAPEKTSNIKVSPTVNEKSE